MKPAVSKLAVGIALVSLSPVVLAVHSGTPTNLVARVGVISLLVFAAIVAIGVYFMKQHDKRTAPVRLLVEEKQTEIHVVAPDVLVAECVRLMNSKKIGALLVMEGERLAGIFTERDALRRVMGAGLDPNDTKVSEVMSENPYSISPTTRVDDAMSIVTERRFRHLPVVEGDKVVAMVSSGDLTRWVVQDKVKEIQELVEVARKS